LSPFVTISTGAKTPAMGETERKTAEPGYDGDIRPLAVDLREGRTSDARREIEGVSRDSLS